MTALLLVVLVQPASEAPDDQFEFVALHVPRPSCGELGCDPFPPAVPASQVRIDASIFSGSSAATAKPSIFTERRIVSLFRMFFLLASNFAKRNSPAQPATNRAKYFSWRVFP